MQVRWVAWGDPALYSGAYVFSSMDGSHPKSKLAASHCLPAAYIDIPFPLPAGVSGPALDTPLQLIEHLLSLAETEQLRWRLRVRERRRLWRAIGQPAMHIVHSKCMPCRACRCSG